MNLRIKKVCQMVHVTTVKWLWLLKVPTMTPILKIEVGKHGEGKTG
jgi:hypothetical protein